MRKIASVSSYLLILLLSEDSNDDTESSIAQRAIASILERKTFVYFEEE